MEYRLGRKDDLDDICSLIASAIQMMEKQGIYQWDDKYPVREDFANDIKQGSLYVAVEDELLLAVYVISTEYDPEYLNGKWECSGDTACIIHRLCVSPDVQDKGVGKAILKHVEDQLVDMGFQSVRLDVYAENPYANRLYENSGYIRRGHADWRKGRFWLMEKKL